MNTQCQMLWGPSKFHQYHLITAAAAPPPGLKPATASLSADAAGAPDVCFSSVNKQGNKYGNCGQLTNGSYVPCAAA